MRGGNTLLRVLGILVSRNLGCRRSLAFSVVLETVGVGLATLGPFLLKAVVDDIAARHLAVAPLLVAIGFFVVAWTGSTALSAIRNVFSVRSNAKVTSHLGAAAVAGVLRSGRWRTTDSAQTQGLLERVPYSVSVVLDGLVWRTVPVVAQLVLSLAVIVRLLSWHYLVGFVLMAAAFVAVSWAGMDRQRGAAAAYNQAVAAAGALVGDILKNARRVVSSGAVNFELANVRCAQEGRESAERAVGLSLLRLSLWQWAAVAGSFMAVLGVAAGDVAGHRITVGDFVLLQAYAVRLIVPLAGIGFVLSQLAPALLTLEEVLSLSADNAIPSGADLPQSPKRGIELECRGLTFSYGPGGGGIRDVSVSFPAASYSAIVGRNGSGKSTLAQLLAGVLVPASGTVRADGQDVRDLDEASRARRVLYLPQRTALLNRDLRSNLLYPPSAHSEGEAVTWLERWNFHEDGRDIELDASVGDQGSALSGGQAQKLEFARVIGVGTPCLILDESSSALDPASEFRIFRDVRDAIGSKTTLIAVVHNAALAEAADQVIWMKSGRVAGVGSHDELLDHFDDYRSLWG